MYSHIESHMIKYTCADKSEIDINLYKQHTLAKKFNLVYDPINDMLAVSTELRKQYDELMKLLFTDGVGIKDINTLTKSVFSLIELLAEQLNLITFEYSPPKKKSDLKLHINNEEYKMIMIASMKARAVCAPVTYLRDNNMAIVRFLYGEICNVLSANGTLGKLEKIIDSIVMSSSAKGLDYKSQLWVLFGAAKGVSPQNIALKERNNIFYKGLPTMKPGMDPVKWLVSMVRTSVNFQMKDKISEVHIAISSPIENTYECNADLLKIFIYEEITSNRQLVKLLNDMPFGNKLMSQYVYPITHYISAPFVSLVFDIPNLNVAHLSNTVLLNLFVYKFMKDAECGWSIFKLLTCRAVPKLKKIKDNPFTENDHSLMFIKRGLTTAIRNQIKTLGFEKSSTYTFKQLEKLAKSIKILFNYDYLDHNDQKIIIPPEILTSEYLRYIYNLSVGTYTTQLNNAKAYVKEKPIINDDGGVFSNAQASNSIFI